MFGVFALFVGAIAAWVLFDRLLSWRSERLQRGPTAWSQFGADRTFHSTGWEETLPPAEPQRTSQSTALGSRSRPGHPRKIAPRPRDFGR